MKKEVPNGHKENQIIHFENQQIPTGRHNGKFMENGQKRRSPEELINPLDNGELKPDVEVIFKQKRLMRRIPRDGK